VQLSPCNPLGIHSRPRIRIGRVQRSAQALNVGAHGPLHLWVLNQPLKHVGQRLLLLQGQPAYRVLAHGGQGYGGTPTALRRFLPGRLTCKNTVSSLVRSAQAQAQAQARRMALSGSVRSTATAHLSHGIMQGNPV
jgi:hypothetical protein